MALLHPGLAARFAGTYTGNYDLQIEEYH